MALRVLRCVKEQTEHGRRELGTPDLPHVGKRGFWSSGQLPKGLLNSGTPAVQKVIEWWVRCAERFFRSQSRTLCRRESLSARVGQKPVGASRQVYKVKTG
jgi:hypothetical protein